MPAPRPSNVNAGPKPGTYAPLKFPVPRTRRVCLGPAKKAHTFLSEGPHNRMCDACRAAVSRLVRGLSPVALHPIAVPLDRE